MIVICPKCGAENSLTAEVCRECGASLLGVMPSPSHHAPEHEEENLELFEKAEPDLPDLLSALKQDDDAPHEKDGEDEVAEDTSQEPSKDLLDFDENEENVPEWLKRIRKRAHDEQDSVGEITQKINTARESLEGDKSEKERSQYESYLGHLRRRAREIKERSGEYRDSNKADSDWLSKIKKAEGRDSDADREDETSLEDRQGDSLLQWLVAVENGEEVPKSLSEIEEEFLERHQGETLPTRVSSQEPDLESTQKMDRDELIFEPPELSITREEQAQADQLAATIVDERASRPDRRPERASLNWLVRLILGVLLIAGLSFSLFIDDDGILPQGLLQPQNEALLLWAREVPADASLLMVFDYAPGYASEISLVARPILNAMIQEGSSIYLVSSTPSGSLLAGRLFSEINAGIALDVKDLGYYPVATYGAYGMASGGLSEGALLDVPEMGKPLPSDEFDGVLVLSDSFEGAQIWVEQLSSLMSETPLNLMVTAQAGAMLLPYWESGQVNGMASGLSEAVGMERALSDGEATSSRWKAYQTGLLILIAVMIIGAIFNTGTRAVDSQRGDL
jgi:hypothetical protein